MITVDDTLERQIDVAGEAMAAGQVVLLPTDTVYGLACSPHHPEAAEQIYHLKNRPSDVRLPVIVTGPEQASGLGVHWTDAADALAHAFWPGALTIAVGVGTPKVPWLAGRDEVGMRAPDSELVLALAQRVGPFLMTSANLHRHATAPSLQEVLADLAGEPDVAIDGGSLSVVASTLVNVNLPEPAIEREGAIDAADVEAVLARVRG